MILPVLNKISSVYQKYSLLKRERLLQLTEDYFVEEIKKYEQESLDSARNAQNYAFDKNISLINKDDSLFSEMDLDIENFIDVEAIRFRAFQRIDLLERQIEQVENLKSEDIDQIMFIASTIPPVEKLSEDLKEIDRDLTRLRVIYTENDPRIKNLIKERLFLLDLAKRQTKGFLMAQKIAAKQKLLAAERPKGVVLKYKSLIKIANDKNIALQQLRGEYRSFLLGKARKTDPWQLITKPRLYPNKVEPKKPRIFAFGIILSLITGIFVSYLLEKRKDLIFDLNEFRSLIGGNLFVEFLIKNEEIQNEIISLLSKGIMKDIKGKVGLIDVSEFDQSTINKLQNSFNIFFNETKFLITQNLNEALECSTYIILVGSGCTKKNKLISLKSQLSLLKKDIFGTIVLNKFESKQTLSNIINFRKKY